MRSSRVDTFTLVTLGRLTLVSPNGVESESLAKRRLKLSVLAVLATAKRPLSRSTLAEMFWGDQDESRARHSLSDALSHLRRELGRSAITTRDAEVSLASDAPVAMDAARFADAVGARNFARAAELYTGPFLDGVEIEAAASFEHWVTRERRRLETIFLEACAHQCLAHARAREWDACGALASRWLDAAPLSVDAALYRLNAVKASGTREAAQRALDEYEQLTARLARDFDLPPEKPVRLLAESIREHLESLPPEPTPEVPAAQVQEATALVRAEQSVPNVALAVDPVPVAPAALTTAKPAWQRRLIRLTSGTVAGAVLIGALAANARTPEPSTANRPRVAIALDVPVKDSATAWLGDGLPQMIVSQLSRSPDVEVIPPGQVTALLRRRGLPPNGTHDLRELRELARLLGASVIVSGTVGHDDRTVVLDLAVRDAASGRLLRSDALARNDAVTLADEPAARVLAAVNAERPGLRIADLETSSVDAYQHFIRATQTGEQGRIAESIRELDAAIALDSGFVSAVHDRLDQAIASYDTDVTDRLRAVLRRNDARATDFDRLRTSTYDALYAGDAERGESIARQLVTRYPRDPRAYAVLNAVLGMRGKFEAAESMWRATIALDSLAMESGPGPCTPCTGYGSLARVQMQEGKWDEAERSTRRWIQLQPEAPGAWQLLASLLAYRQRGEEAITASRHAISLAGTDPSAFDLFARILVMTRRYDRADSLVALWLTSPRPELRATAYDVNVLMLREHGQYRASLTALDRLRAESPNVTAAAPDLMQGATLGRLGDYRGAADTYERVTHMSDSSATFPPRGTSTRGYCWHHALLADAIAASGDIKRLTAIADTLEIGCARSFYGRDRVLYHHVRGLIASSRGHWLLAAAEFRAARWGVSEAWTRTNVALSKAELVLGQPRAAVATLRDAYTAPLDGMGRYQPRSELDFLMAQAFEKAGERDSAAVYGAYARRAWRNADPEVKRLLEH